MFFFFILFVTFFCLDGFSQEIITIEIDGSNLPDECGTLSKGKEIYLKSCSKCHGYSGEGLYGPELVGRSSLDNKNISSTLVYLVLFFLTLQVILGIITLLSNVYLPVASLHQTNSILLLSTLLISYHQIKIRKVKNV